MFTSDKIFAFYFACLMTTSIKKEKNKIIKLIKQKHINLKQHAYKCYKELSLRLSRIEQSFPVLQFSNITILQQWICKRDNLRSNNTNNVVLKKKSIRM